MSVEVATPGPTVKTYSSGLKVVRLTEFMGGARGTLGTIADSDSPAGTVVREQQNLGVATTTGARWSSVSDTIVLPKASMDFPSDTWSYDVWLSLRVFGRPPSNARMDERWNSQKTNLGPTVAMLLDSSVSLTHCRVPRSTYAHYTLVNLGFLGSGSLTSVTNLKLRAWGINDMEIRLDLLYFVPRTLKATDAWTQYFPGDYPAMGLGSGAVTPDMDDSPTLTVGGVHSVMPFTKSGNEDAIWDSSAGWDYQANDDEPAQVNMASGDFFDRETSKSFLIVAGAGPRLVNYHTVEDEDLAGATAFTKSFKTSQGYMVSAAGSNIQGTYFPNINPGMWLQPGSLRVYGGGAASIPYSARSFALWDLGSSNFSSGSTSDPRNYCPVLSGIESYVLLVAITPEFTPSGASVQFVAGGLVRTTPGSATATVACGAVVTHDTSGSMTIRLMKAQSDVGDGGTGFNFVAFGSAAASVPGGTGSTTWIRVEKRFTHWRARAWLDGSSEPSSWHVEGYEPFALTNSISGSQFVQYPYDSNWPTSGTNTIHHDPRNGQGPTLSYAPGGMIQFAAGFSVANYNAKFESIRVDYDPDYPDGNGGYVGAHFRLEKHDGSELWGEVDVPTGAMRVLTSGLEPHHFDFDTNGGNFWAWLDPGGHPLESAAYGPIYARRTELLYPLGLLRMRAYQASTAGAAFNLAKPYGTFSFRAHEPDA